MTQVQENTPKNGVEVKDAVLVSETTKTKQNRYKLDLTKKSPLIQNIRDKLDYYVIGQDKAKDEIVDALSRTLVDDPSRTKPIANMMLLGPTGVGKTQVARALFWILFGDENASIGQCKIDANSFKDYSELSNLTGASPKYVGREQIPILSDMVLFKAYHKAKKNGSLHPILDNYSDFGILLIDEVEKACIEFHDLFLGIMDEGILELSSGTEEGKTFKEGGFDYHKTTNFKNVLIIFTSNVGADDIQDKLKGKGTVGFNTDKSTDINTILSIDYYKDLVKESKVFKPEFLARLDSFIPFQNLTKEEYYKRLALSIDIHNKKYAENSDIKLFLSSQAQKHIVEKSMSSGEGARKLVKIFDKDIITIYTRSVFNNSEVDRVEEDSGNKVKYIEVDYVDEKYIGYALIDENKKALNKELKKAAILSEKQKKLSQQETIISIRDNSLLLTLKSDILPALQYYRALVTQKDELFSDDRFSEKANTYLNFQYHEEIEATRKILDSFGFKDRDYSILNSAILEERYYSYTNMFDDMNLTMSSVKLWSEDEAKYAFSGMIRYIEKYMKNFFEGNKDLKSLVSEGAGSLSEVMEPFMSFSKKLVNRELALYEENIILRIFHREYSKLHGRIYINLLSNPDKKKKAKEEKVETKTKKEAEKNITININFAGSENQTNWKTRLQNLFADDFEKVIIAIKQNMPSADNSNDIIDILGAIKIELEAKIGINLTSNQSMELHDIVKMLLKEDDIIPGLDDIPEKD